MIKINNNNNKFKILKIIILNLYNKKKYNKKVNYK